MPSTDVAFSAPFYENTAFCRSSCRDAHKPLCYLHWQCHRTAGILRVERTRDYMAVSAALRNHATLLMRTCRLSAVVHSLFRPSLRRECLQLILPSGMGDFSCDHAAAFEYRTTVLPQTVDLRDGACCRHYLRGLCKTFCFGAINPLAAFLTFIGIVVMQQRPTERAEVKSAVLSGIQPYSPYFRCSSAFCSATSWKCYLVINNDSSENTLHYFILASSSALFGATCSHPSAAKRCDEPPAARQRHSSAPPAPAMPRSDSDTLQDNKVPATGAGVSAQSASFNCDTFRAPMPETLPATDGKTPNPQADTPASTKDETTDVSRPEDFSYPRSKTADALRPDVRPPTSTRPNNGTGRLRLTWLLQEWIHSLAGVALYFLVDAISCGGYLF